MLKKYPLKALEVAINQALMLDPQMPSKLEELDGKVLEMIIAPLDVNFFIQFKDNQIHLLDVYEGQADTRIHSNPLGLIRLSLLPASKARSLFNDKIRLSGDTELGQKVKQLFDDLDIDWEGHLAYFTGDVIAHQIGSFVRQGLAFKNHFKQSMSQNTTEYLQEELRLLPSRQELCDFYQDIDEIAMAVERLQAKLNLLMRP